MTRSMAESMPMLPLPGRSMKALKPCVLTTPMKCQVSHKSEAMTKGKPTRLTNWRTSLSMEPIMSRISTPPQSNVGPTTPRSIPTAFWPMACVPSRMMTSSKVVHPISWAMLSNTGKRAKALPYTRCINPALDRPLSQPSFAVEASKAEPAMEPIKMAMIASRVPTAGTR